MTGYLATEAMLSLPSWASMALWVTLSVIAAVAILQPIKGGVIGLQWANRMHGFATSTDEADGPGSGISRP